jgi:hypothetical protein
MCVMCVCVCAGTLQSTIAKCKADKLGYEAAIMASEEAERANEAEVDLEAAARIHKGIA